METKAVSGNEIQGGEKRYTHQQYGMLVTLARDYTKIRFYKKPWVPAWLWNLFATPDWLDVADAAFARASKEHEEKVARSLHALNQESPIKLTAKEWKDILEDEL